MKAADLCPNRLRALLLGAAAIALFGPCGQGLAQSAPAAAPPATAGTAQELERLRAEQQQAAEDEKRLQAEVAAIGEDRRKLNEALIATAARIRSVEAQIAEAEAQLAQLAANEKAIRTALDGRRAVLAEVLAALQRIGRRPPPAILVRPQDALEAVRAAMLLGAVLPEMRAEAERLAADLGSLVRLRKDQATQRDRLARDLATWNEEKARLALLIEERQKRQSAARQALDAVRERARALARQAGDLNDLIAKLEQGLDSISRAAQGHESANSQSNTRRNLAALKDPGRLTPAIVFAAAKGQLPLPVNGVKTRDFGAPDGLGGTERGISIATRPGAQVTSPCDCWVVYAAPYRSYGQLLILNAGGGYHVLLAGMERILVDFGQFVLTGEPVAIMGSGPQVAPILTAGMTGSSQPVLYIEFRKDGTPVDPNPWWATTDSAKVRG